MIKEFLVLLEQFADNKGLVLGDLDDNDIHKIAAQAWKLSQAAYNEIKEREAIEHDQH
jgi:hypothetical protein